MFIRAINKQNALVIRYSFSRTSNLMSYLVTLILLVQGYFIAG